MQERKKRYGAKAVVCSGDTRAILPAWGRGAGPATDAGAYVFRIHVEPRGSVVGAAVER